MLEHHYFSVVLFLTLFQQYCVIIHCDVIAVVYEKFIPWVIFTGYEDKRVTNKNYTTVITKFKGMPRSMLRQNGLWEVIHIYPFNTMWRNTCIWSSKSYQLHVDFTFQMWCWPCIFHISCKKSNSGETLLLQVNLPLLKHTVDKYR